MIFDNLTVQFPSIGPTYIHFYETSRKSNYLGRLLLSISTEPDTRMTKTIHNDIQEILPLLEVKEFYSLKILFLFNLNEFRLTSGRSKHFKYALFCLVLSTSKIITVEYERNFDSQSCPPTVWNLH